MVSYGKNIFICFALCLFLAVPAFAQNAAYATPDNWSRHITANGVKAASDRITAGGAKKPLESRVRDKRRDGLPRQTGCQLPYGSWKNTPAKNCIVCHKTRPVLSTGALHAIN